MILEGVLGKHWQDTSMGAHCKFSPETDHDFLRYSPLMEFHVEVCQAYKWRGSKPVITSKAHHLSQMHKTR